VMNSVNGLIVTNGHELQNSSWDIILAILKEVIKHVETAGKKTGKVPYISSCKKNRNENFFTI